MSPTEVLPLANTACIQKKTSLWSVRTEQVLTNCSSSQPALNDGVGRVALAAKTLDALKANEIILYWKTWLLVLRLFRVEPSRFYHSVNMDWNIFQEDKRQLVINLYFSIWNYNLKQYSALWRSLVYKRLKLKCVCYMQQSIYVFFSTVVYYYTHTRVKQTVSVYLLLKKLHRVLYSWLRDMNVIYWATRQWVFRRNDIFACLHAETRGAV